MIYIVTYTKRGEECREEFLSPQEARYRMDMIKWEPGVSLISMYSMRVEKHTEQEAVL